MARPCAGEKTARVSVCARGDQLWLPEGRGCLRRRLGAGSMWGGTTRSLQWRSDPNKRPSVSQLGKLVPLH